MYKRQGQRGAAGKAAGFAGAAPETVGQPAAGNHQRHYDAGGLPAGTGRLDRDIKARYNLCLLYTSRCV